MAIVSQIGLNQISTATVEYSDRVQLDERRISTLILVSFLGEILESPTRRQRRSAQFPRSVKRDGAEPKETIPSYFCCHQTTQPLLVDTELTLWLGFEIITTPKEASLTQIFTTFLCNLYVFAW